MPTQQQKQQTKKASKKGRKRDFVATTAPSPDFVSVHGVIPPYLTHYPRGHILPEVPKKPATVPRPFSFAKRTARSAKSPVQQTSATLPQAKRPHQQAVAERLATTARFPEVAVLNSDLRAQARLKYEAERNEHIRIAEEKMKQLQKQKQRESAQQKQKEKAAAVMSHTTKRVIADDPQPAAAKRRRLNATMIPQRGTFK
eukprot:TRINITY_DN1858_c0_g1_i2.p2 TRINITY_DN1858_c0_g1~~TRINITY_DN1858_c0_g1_i2.p2  ORF type:complete len:200 (-),score=48.98 TRINITY_DN1858_c0_g1_i2:56-655(-)